MKKDLNYILAVLVIVLSIMVIGMGIYLFADKKDDESYHDNIVDGVECNEDYTFNTSKLSKISEGDFNIIKMEYNDSHSFSLDVSGKVIIDFNNYIDNISDAKDILLFNSEQGNILYILTLSGDVYKYNVLSLESDEFTAGKIDEYSNIKKMFIYNTRKNNSGGCDYVVLIDSDDNYHQLISLCV